MKKNQLQKLTTTMIAVSLLLSGFYGCKKQEASQIFPPVVFMPVSGEFAGGPIKNNLIVTTVEETTGKIVKGAEVFIHQGDPVQLIARLETNDEGIADFKTVEMVGPVTVTVTCNKSIAYDTVSFVNINAARLTIPLVRRKKAGKTKTALTFAGLDSGDTMLNLSRNDVPFKEKQIKAGTLEEDPLIVTVPAEPLSFSALVMDAAGNTTKYGFAVEPEAPIPAATPATINLIRVNSDNVRVCKGKIENPPANLGEPTDGWDPYKRYIFQVFADGGQAGDVVTGFANLARDYTYQAFIIQSPGLDKMKFEVTATNRSDAWSETSTVYKYFSFENAPSTADINFISVPKNLQISKVEKQILPDLIWESFDGNLIKVDIYHADYDYHWSIFIPGEKVQKLVLPPLDLGSPGALLGDEIYRFKVTALLIPDFDFNKMNFQTVRNTLTHKAASTLVKFMLKAPDDK